MTSSHGLPRVGANLAAMLPMICGVAALMAVAMLVLLEPRSTGDTYIWLASGRDVLLGKLGEPDQWSFITDGRVWLDQNWGTGVVFYLAWLLIGPNGVVAIKGLAIAGISASLLALLRQRGASWPVALLVSAATLFALRYYVDMRANLFTLLFIPTLTWLLAKGRLKPRYLWLSAAVIMVWANTHGGFIFGLGMFGLWTICVFLASALCGPLEARWHLPWNWIAATWAAVALTAFANPFGLANLIHPITMMLGDGEVWRTVREWEPPLKSGIPSFGSPREFFVWVGLTTAFASAWVVLRLSNREPILGRLGEGRLADLLFDVALALIASAMALMAQRFMPLFILAAAPLIGRGAQFWFARRSAFAWATAGLLSVGLVLALNLEPLAIVLSRHHALIDARWGWIAAVLVLTLLPVVALIAARSRTGRIVEPDLDQRDFAPWPVFAATLLLMSASLFYVAPRIIVYYQNYTHRHPSSSLFDKMIVSEGFPQAPARFLLENGIDGKVFNDWRWEGYLRWTHPGLKIFMGGRAQSIYSPAEFRRYNSMLRADTHPEEFTAQGANLILLSKQDARLIHNLLRIVSSRLPRWKPLYFDGQLWVLADSQDPSMRALLLRARNGDLVYSDAVVARLSLARLIAKSSVGEFKP